MQVPGSYGYKSVLVYFSCKTPVLFKPEIGGTCTGIPAIGRSRVRVARVREPFFRVTLVFFDYSFAPKQVTLYR